MTGRLVGTMLVLASLVTAGCGDDEAATPTSPSVPEASVDATTRLFTGTLSPRGSVFYSFTVPQDSGVFLTLASLTASGGRTALAAPITLGLGVPRGTGCAASTTITTTADLSAQIREWRPTGVHCASLADPGTLTADVSFAVRIGYFQ